jgi:enoyl-CoA hydratase/carnithine racemase
MGDIISVTDAGVMRVRLNRPAKKNAITRAMYEDLTGALARAGDDEAVRAVVVTAEGSDFCAGNDILDFAQGLGDFHSAPLDDLPVFRFLRALTFFEKPLIAGVQGQAVGIGVTLLLHCDLAVVADDVRLSLPFLKLGLVPEAGSTLLLPQRIGHARAFEWMTAGDAMGAEEAHRLGLVNAVVDASALAQTADDMAARLLRLSPSSLRHTKRLMRDPEALWQVVRAEGEIFRRQLQSPEAAAAFAAFLNR